VRLQARLCRRGGLGWAGQAALQPHLPNLNAIHSDPAAAHPLPRPPLPAPARAAPQEPQLPGAGMPAAEAAERHAAARTYSQLWGDMARLAWGAELAELAADAAARVGALAWSAALDPEMACLQVGGGCGGLPWGGVRTR
jgi:hypothetical protein